MLRGFCLAWGGLPGPGWGHTEARLLLHCGLGGGARRPTLGPRRLRWSLNPIVRAVRPRDRSGGRGRSLLTLPLARITVNTKLGSRSSMSHLRHMYSMPRL